MTESSLPGQALAAIEFGVCELLERSTAALTTGESEAGLADARAALSVATEPLDRARALGLILQHAWRGGDLVAAYRAGLDAAEAWNGLDALEANKTLCFLSLVCADLGAFGESLNAATRAFEVAKAVGSLPRMAVALNAVGTARHRMGDHVQGRLCLLQALAFAEEDGAAEAILSALNNLSSSSLLAYRDLVEVKLMDEAAASAAQAVSFAQRAVTLAETLGDQFRLAAVLANLGEALGLTGEGPAALATLARAEAIALARRNAGLELHVRGLVGELLVRDGQWAQAVEHLQITLQRLSDEQGELRRIVLSSLRHALKGLGRFEEALTHCEALLAYEQRRVTERERTLASLAVNRSDLQMVQLAHERERERNTQLEQQTLQDPLTGLPNRRGIDRVFATLEPGAIAVVVMLDIDHFKRVNDVFGHAVGDAVLREMAQLLPHCLRENDTAARLGGEEFCLVLWPSKLEVASAIAERVRAAIEAADWWHIASGLTVTASLGLAMWHGNATVALERADQALYEAKRSGRNRVCIAAD